MRDLSAALEPPHTPVAVNREEAERIAAVIRLLERSRREQDLPPRITSSVALRNLAVLIGQGRAEGRAEEDGQHGARQRAYRRE